jgi:hypothetical protein
LNGNRVGHDTNSTGLHSSIGARQVNHQFDNRSLARISMPQKPREFRMILMLLAHERCQLDAWVIQALLRNKTLCRNGQGPPPVAFLQSLGCRMGVSMAAGHRDIKFVGDSKRLFAHEHSLAPLFVAAFKSAGVVV